MSYLGTTKIGKIYLGSTALGKVYLGNTLIFQKGGGPTPPPGPAPLPSGAIPCQLVFGDGYSAYIETGFTPLPTMSIEMDVCWVVNPSTYASVIGYSINSQRYGLNINQNGRHYDWGYGSMYGSNVYPGHAGLQRYKHKIVATPNGATVETYTPDGVTLLDTTSFSYNASVNFNQTLGLITRKSSASGAFEGEGRSGLGVVKIYGDDHFGSLAAQFVPCYYQGSFGFWEGVSGTMKYGNDPTKIYGLGSAWNTEDFWPNSFNSTDTSNGRLYNLTDWRGCVTSPMFRIPQGCTTIRFNAGTLHTSGTYYDIVTFDANSVWKHYWQYNSTDRQITGFSDSTYVRMTMPVGKINDCYIYDVTNGQYIWKGINV